MRTIAVGYEASDLACEPLSIAEELSIWRNRTAEAPADLVAELYARIERAEREKQAWQ